jgi:S-adenosyl-L-methionine hydrolase (adenosine-forming)
LRPGPSVPARPRLVTLSTDVGSAYAAQMKGVLYRSLPAGHVVDLTHDLPPHRIAEAAFLVRQMAVAFPAGTVHLVVVDPGVGGDRAAIAQTTRDGSCLVGPDNGVLAPLAARLGVAGVVRLDPERIQAGGPVGRTFEGRDLFAPAAARLALGAKLGTLGAAWRHRPLDLPEAEITPSGARGMIMHLDHFGNAITNIPTAALPASTRSVELILRGRRRHGVPVRPIYETLPRDGLGLVSSSFGTLELAVRERSAAAGLHLRVGQTVRIRWRSAGTAPKARK